MRLFEIDVSKGSVYGKQLIETIKTDCKPWLQETNDGALKVYRGVPKTLDIVTKRRVRRRRRPRDSAPEWHKLFNGLIKEKGLVANRTNSIFVSGEPEQVYEYGEVFVILPVGNFNYTWHKEIDDWFLFWQRDHTDLRRYLDFELPKHLEKQVRHYVEKWVTKRKGKNYLERIQKLENEIKQTKDEKSLRILKIKLDDVKEMLNSLIDQRVKLELKRRQYYRPEIREKVLDGLYGDDGTLKEAIRSGNEIMIKCDYAYYIKPSLYTNYVLPSLRDPKFDPDIKSLWTKFGINP